MNNIDEKLKEYTKANIWNHIRELLPILKRVNNRTWLWIENPDCKYIDVRIDMRTLHCVILDNNGNRILPEQLAYQSNDISNVLIPNRARQERRVKND
jgi:hypothetical protein